MKSDTNKHKKPMNPKQTHLLQHPTPKKQNKNRDLKNQANRSNQHEVIHKPSLTQLKQMTHKCFTLTHLPTAPISRFSRQLKSQINKQHNRNLLEANKNGTMQKPLEKPMSKRKYKVVHYVQRRKN